ncbi:AGE family epimerase/isomerase [Caulobacter sp. DWP3-1-3b2]|uniref:AGE family epimerase/isomerase n=1 Tax=Caulobacter sp. DWP3-1-3b2 TaxID=2804643 RepID=UPI003CEB7EC0
MILNSSNSHLSRHVKSESINIRFDDVASWIKDYALPYWFSVGVDRENGGFVEHLDLNAANVGGEYKRTRAQARQIYCYSQAALLNLHPQAEEAAAHGWRFLTDNARLADGAYARRLTPDGTVLDATCDAYDMAFVLFAHAWWYRVSGEAEVVRSALSALTALNARLRHPNGLGWLAEEGDTGPRQQNPHMHMIEAAIELADATGRSEFFELACEILLLFRERIIDEESGVLRELFAADWSPLDSPAGLLVEPGHQMEWAWILNRAGPVLGVDASDLARALYASAERYGVAKETGLTFDQVDIDGRVIAASHRSWPQTEALKANLAMLETDGLDTRERIGVCTRNLLDRYLDTTPRGVWIDHLDARGEPMVDKIPSTTFYHLQLAFTELLRLRTRIEAFGAL